MTAATRPKKKSAAELREERPELVRQALALRAQGLSYKHIGHRLGIRFSTASGLVNDPTGEKDRARRAKYGGTCSECGRPTSGSSGREKAPTICLWCATGGKLGVQPPDFRRRIPVRLSEIPKERRLEAAREACRIEKGEHERKEILLAALMPSNTVYWVAA